MKAVPTYTVEGFKSNKAATGRLAELLHDPVMEEALCIVQSNSMRHYSPQWKPPH